MRRSLPGLALVVVLALLVAACSASSGSDSARDDQTTTTDPEQGGPATTGPLGSGTSPIADGIRIEVLSSQPDRVTGDDVRVRITPAPGSATGDLRVQLGDVDVTAKLTPTDGALEGVIDGLIEGNNTLTASAGGSEVLQRLRAWPITGPVISGPHLPLLACSTEENGLGRPTDTDCSAPTTVTAHYITKTGTIANLPGGTIVPTDLATATIGGEEVPLYVRLERGVINRSIYEIASIDPTPTDDDPTGPGWNGKVVYRYGGGCGTTYGQGSSSAEVLDPAYLEQGYAVATATFNTFAVQCNDVLSAETTMMVKERLIEAFGLPQFTIGEGASGGAIQLHLMAQNYPGLINAAVASTPFPDALSIAPGVTDCGLLLHYYDTADGKTLTAEQRTAINGHATDATCRSWAQAYLPTLDPTVGCDPKIPADQIYNPDANRGGLRCTLQDANRNQMGTDATTGFAARPLDNVGLQYGLEALNDGGISVDQFLDLNEAIGGYNLDGVITDQREEADPEAVLHAYETGRITMGGGDLLNIPIIDINTFTDPAGDIHDRFRAFSLRDRLTFGGSSEEAPGFQIWTRPGGTDIDATAVQAVEVLDRWLTLLRDDPGGSPLPNVLVRTRPADAVDSCIPPGARSPRTGVGIYEQDGPCQDDYPIAGDPRTAAGGPRSGQVLKCELMDPDPLDYAVAMSADQFDRLQEIFPQGVCDWSSPSIGETIPASPDRTYEDVESPGQSA